MDKEIPLGSRQESEEKIYRFRAERVIWAESQEEAEALFADNSFDFAGEADCEQVCERHHLPILETEDDRCQRCVNADYGKNKSTN